MGNLSLKKRERAQQLAFGFVTATQSGVQFVVSGPLRKHRRCNGLLKKLHYARRFFPELEGRVIRVGLTRVASGMAVPGGNELWFNPAQVSHHAIAHEFTHLLQGSDDIPSGERSCDLFALARHWTLNDTAPYYLRLPVTCVTKDGKLTPTHAMLVCELARRAVDMRRSGTRNYISFFEKTLSVMAAIPASHERPARDESASHRPSWTDV